MHECPICAKVMQEAFRAVVLQKYEAVYDNCAACGFLRARSPHWLEESYSSAIATTDTGLLARNMQISKKLTALLPQIAKEGPYLDYAGGYGVLTRMMRDRGFDFFWTDKFCDNVHALGFEYREEMTTCQAVTAFEVLEHVEDPASMIRDAMRCGAETFIFSTELYSGKPPRPDQWWYYALETGQHISFYRRDTLNELAARLKLHFTSCRGIHIFSARPLPKLRIRMVLNRLTPLIARLSQRPTKVWSDHQKAVQHLLGTE